MNHRLGVSLLLVTAATISFMPQSHADELVTNGGFEQTVSAPNVTGLNPAGWTVVSPETYTFDTCGSDGAPAHSGSCAMNFGSLTSASLSQTLATVAGDTYSVRFYLGDFLTQGNGPDNSFQVAFGGTTIFSETNFPLGSYALINETVEATSNSTVLSFQGFDVPNSIGLDDVSVSTASTVPEPSTFALLGAGILGAAGMLRRKLIA